MESAESKIRAAVESINGLIIGSWYPVSVTHNGVTVNFLANIKKVVSNGKHKSAIHLLNIKRGKLLAHMDVQYIANYYKLDRNNKLEEIGLPGEPTELTLKKWNSSFA